MHIPNILTLLRILLVPFLMLFFYIPYFRTPEGSVLLALLFLAASFTDWLDGHLARKRSQITSLGKFLDPIADKILILSLLILLVGENRAPAWLVAAMMSREFIVTGLRLIAIGEGVVVAAESLGKYKTFCQSIATVFLITAVNSGLYFYEIGVTLLISSFIMALFSAGQYCQKVGQQIAFIRVR